MPHTLGPDFSQFQGQPSGKRVTLGHCCLERAELAPNRDHQFVSLLNAFRRSGGLARTPEVAARFARRGSAGVYPLANWLVKRQVVCITWRDSRWFPLFQFDTPGLRLKPDLAGVLDELVRKHDDWSVASWFARPNVWLAHATPADSLTTLAPLVLMAARRERRGELIAAQGLRNVVLAA